MAEEQKQQIPIKVSEEELKGRYSNLMQVMHGQEEFVLDFFNVFAPAGVSVSRIILSPGHLKRMLIALEDNLKGYEQKFGKVDPADAPESGEIGFKP